MGKIVYKCMVDPDYLTIKGGLLGTDRLPQSFQDGVAAKKLDSESAKYKLRKFFLKKFPAPKKQRSFSIFRKSKPTKERDISAKPCWFLDVVDKLDEKGAKVTGCKESAYIPNQGAFKEMERVVSVSCEFTQGSELKYFLKYTAKDNYEMVGKTMTQVIDEIHKQMDPQLTKLKRETIEELKDKDKIKVKINYKLKY